MNAPWMLVANYLKGVTEAEGAVTNPKIDEMFRIAGHGGVDDDETPWCAAFVGACLRLSGYKSTGSLRARSYDGFGERLAGPRLGCIVVFWRTSETSPNGHVAFYVSHTNTKITVLGGNQANSVRVQDYAAERLLGYFWPIERDSVATSPLIKNITQLQVGPQDEDSRDPAAGATDMDEEMRAGVPGDDTGGDSGSSNFGLIQPIIDKWEGGYVDHPEDPGGATNMGITQRTLSEWRGRPVSKAEVRALSRQEAWQIMKARYYDIIRGDDLPLPVAVAVYNAAVLSGPRRAGRWLQTSLRQLGSNVGVDGAIGPQTLAAVANVDATQLAQTFFGVQEAFLRSLGTFPTFGRGWMNRLNDVRSFALNLRRPVMNFDGGNLVPPVRLPAPVPNPAPNPEPSNASALTPVNNALGETIGNVLNGRKTGLGVLGLLGSGLVEASGATAASGGVAGALASVVPYAVPIAGALTAWGVLGKVDKWVQDVRK
jgi:uncharacterized protein (TIGR02594 family)